MLTPSSTGWPECTRLRAATRAVQSDLPPASTVAASSSSSSVTALLMLWVLYRRGVESEDDVDLAAKLLRHVGMHQHAGAGAALVAGEGKVRVRRQLSSDGSRERRGHSQVRPALTWVSYLLLGDATISNSTSMRCTGRPVNCRGTLPDQMVAGEVPDAV